MMSFLSVHFAGIYHIPPNHVLLSHKASQWLSAKAKLDLNRPLVMLDLADEYHLKAKSRSVDCFTRAVPESETVQICKDSKHLQLSHDLYIVQDDQHGANSTQYREQLHPELRKQNSGRKLMPHEIIALQEQFITQAKTCMLEVNLVPNKKRSKKYLKLALLGL